MKTSFLTLGLAHFAIHLPLRLAALSGSISPFTTHHDECQARTFAIK
jgi:hypothetical protein